MMRGFTGALVIALSAATAAAAQPWPTKPIRLIVSYAPGGGTDIAARIVARRLSEQLGQQVIVDNRPGANGSIGNELAARATADGYTLLMAVSADAINAGLYPKLPFDLTTDFAPVSQVSSTAFMLVVHPSVTANSVKELIDLAKASPAKLNYATFGTAGIPNLAIELIKSRTGVDMVQIPYKGSGPALADVMTGQVQLMVAPVSAFTAARESRTAARPGRRKPQAQRRRTRDRDIGGIRIARHHR
jgi:tripartite-type tricarboxylate transporter receptor subunit TctC